MSHQNIDTSKLWKSLMLLAGLIVGLCFLAFTILLLRDSGVKFSDGSTYSEEFLADYTEQRIMAVRAERSEDWSLVENGVHVKTGLKDDEHLQLVIANCISCHSAKLIIQNSATRDGWKSMIKWMQSTQGLPDLGSDEPKILDYLAEHYAPQETGRRANLDVAAIEWYILELD